MGGQKNWFTDTKPIEELYDTENDPWELVNLADKDQYADRLDRMRKAVESWQERIGDTGMIPESVLMGEMKPEGRTPQVEPPLAAIDGGNITFTSPTEGASVVYRTKFSGQNWSDWGLFSKSVALPPGATVEALACRIGLRDSKTIQERIPK